MLVLLILICCCCLRSPTVISPFFILRVALLLLSGRGDGKKESRRRKKRPFLSPSFSLFTDFLSRCFPMEKEETKAEGARSTFSRLFSFDVDFSFFLWAENAGKCCVVKLSRQEWSKWWFWTAVLMLSWLKCDYTCPTLWYNGILQDYRTSKSLIIGDVVAQGL